MAHGARPGAPRSGLILGVETSCDDTCAALVTDDGEVLSNVVSSQGLPHAPFGGVVPEVASRHHLELIDAVIADALARAGAGLDDVQRVAVTQGPGLIGALLVGVSAAKALAAARGLPLTPVDHLHGHVVASTLQPDPIEPPYLVLVASGGHTFLARVDEPSSYTVLGQTLDDAAGEAFDKGARLLGLPYPGGPELDRLAQDGRPGGVQLPPVGARRRPGLLLQRPEDGAALPAARRAGRRPRRPGRLLPAGDRGVAHRAASSRRSSARAWIAWRWEGAWRPTPSCAIQPARWG